MSNSMLQDAPKSIESILSTKPTVFMQLPVSMSIGLAEKRCFALHVSNLLNLAETEHVRATCDTQTTGLKRIDRSRRVTHVATFA
jgi:hypothetical protein